MYHPILWGQGIEKNQMYIESNDVNPPLISDPKAFNGLAIDDMDLQVKNCLVVNWKREIFFSSKQSLFSKMSYGFAF